VHHQAEVEAEEVEAVVAALDPVQPQAPLREHQPTKSSWMLTTSLGACMACHL